MKMVSTDSWLGGGPDDRLHWLSLGDVVRENRRRYPLRLAAVCGSARITYAELDDRTTRLDNALQVRGVETGGRIVWLGQICRQSLELLIAAAKLGAILCPVNWRLGADEMAFRLDDVEPKIVFWQEMEIGGSVQAGRQAARLAADWVQVDGDDSDYEGWISAASAVDQERPVDPGSPVLIIYTAAFEGRPGGALLSHTGLINTAIVRAWVSGIGGDDVYLNATNVYHIGTWDYGMLPMLITGGMNVFMRRWAAAEAARVVAQHRVTFAFMAGPMDQQLVEEGKTAGLDLSTLRPPQSVADRIGGYGQSELHGVQTFRF